MQILIGLSNKNPRVKYQGVKSEISEKQSSQSLALTSAKSSDRIGYPISTNQTEYPLYETSD